MDWSFMDALGDDYVTIARQCAHHSKNLLSIDSSHYRTVSLNALASTCTSLASTLKSSVANICISTCTEQNDTFDVNLSGDRLDIVFQIGDRTSAVGVGRAVLHCLCSSVAKEHDTKRNARVVVYNKWRTLARQKLLELSEQKNKDVSPLKSTQRELERNLKDKEVETREETSAVRRKIEKQWLRDWLDSTPSKCKHKHSKLCDSSSKWVMCKHGCGTAWCTHRKCGYTSTKCPDCGNVGDRAYRSCASPPKSWLQDQSSAVCKSIEEKSNQVCQAIKQELNDVNDKIRSIENDYRTEKSRVDDATYAGQTEELNNLAKPGGVAYRF
jgi:hypothetical protein